MDVLKNKHNDNIKHQNYTYKSLSNSMVSYLEALISVKMRHIDISNLLAIMHTEFSIVSQFPSNCN